MSLTPPHEVIERHFASVYIPLLSESAIHVQSFHKHPRKRGTEEIVKTYGDQLTDSLRQTKCTKSLLFWPQFILTRSRGTFFFCGWFTNYFECQVCRWQQNLGVKGTQWQMPDQNVQADVGYLTYIYSQPLTLQHQELQRAKVLSKKIHLNGNTTWVCPQI